MTITLTKSAAEHVKNILEKRGYGLGLRLATRESGCSGFSYIVDYADAATEEDTVFESQGVKILVDKQYLQQLDGVELDYGTSDGPNRKIKFYNPNVQSICGCGESFNV